MTGDGLGNQGLRVISDVENARGGVAARCFLQGFHAVARDGSRFIGVALGDVRQNPGFTGRGAARVEAAHVFGHHACVGTKNALEVLAFKDLRIGFNNQFAAINLCVKEGAVKGDVGCTITAERQAEVEFARCRYAGELEIPFLAN